MHWDVSSFGNEQAQAWLTSLSDHESTDIIEKTLAVVNKSNIFIDSQDAEIAVAAAEIVAASHKRPSDLLPMDAALWIKENNYQATSSAVIRAAKVVDKIYKNSELRDLWDGTDASIEWQRAMKDLITRLKQIEFEPETDEEVLEIEQQEEEDTANNTKMEALFEEAIQFVAAGNHRGAVGKFDQALELDSDYVLGYIGRGTSFLSLGKYSEAVSDFNEAIDRDPEIADAYYLRAQAYFQQSNHGRAIADLTILLNLQPKKVDAFVMRGLANFTLGRDKQSMSDLNKAIELDPNKANAYLQRAKIYDRQGDFDLAGKDRKKYKDLVSDAEKKEPVV